MMLEMRDGIKLYIETTKSESKNYIIHVHGICEHMGRHDYVKKLFSDKFNVLQMDLRGHGKSEGKRVYVDSFFQYIDDLFEIIDNLKKKKSAPKYILMGHSMGAMIVCGYLQRYRGSEYNPSGVFITSPPIGLPGAQGIFAEMLPKGITGFLSNLGAGIMAKDVIDLKGLSHDETTAQKYVDDKLNSLSIHTRLMFNLVNAAKNIFSEKIDPEFPMMCTVGGEDRVVSEDAIVKYFLEVEKSVELKVFEGAFHEVHNEIAKYRDSFMETLKNFVYSINL